MGGTQPLFDMSKAQPITPPKTPPPTSGPLFDMSKATPLQGAAVNQDEGQGLPPVTTSTNPKLAAAMAQSQNQGLDTGLTRGALKGGLETAHTLGRVINAATGDSIKWLPTSLDQPKDLEASGAGEMLGKIGESVAEFALGDAALKGLSIAEKLGIAHKITQLAQESPTLAKLLNLGLNATRGATVGAVTGGAHEGAEGAEAGAVGGAAAEGIGAVGKLGKSLLFPNEAVQSQVTKDLIKSSLGGKVDADVAEELASRMDKPKILSSVENELKLVKGKIDTELPALNKNLDDVLSKSTNKTGNAARMIGKTFDDQISDVTSGVGTNKQEAVNAINDVRKEVLGKLTNDPMGAQEVNEVKRLVGDQIKKFAPPENLTTTDAQKKEAYRQAYFSLRDIVDQLSPESKDLNFKISRGISAQELLERKFPQLETAEQAKASYSGTRSEAAKHTAKQVGKAVGRGVAIGTGAKVGYDILRGVE